MHFLTNIHTRCTREWCDFGPEKKNDIVLFQFNLRQLYLTYKLVSKYVVAKFHHLFWLCLFYFFFFFIKIRITAWTKRDTTVYSRFDFCNAIARIARCKCSICTTNEIQNVNLLTISFLNYLYSVQLYSVPTSFEYVIQNIKCFWLVSPLELKIQQKQKQMRRKNQTYILFELIVRMYKFFVCHSHFLHSLAYQNEAWSDNQMGAQPNATHSILFLSFYGKTFKLWI